MTANNSCSDAMLRSLLASSEDSHDLLEASKHIDSCLRCQHRLRELAGTEEDWREARNYLVSARPDEEMAEDQALRPSRWNAHFPALRPLAWTESMAEQLLSPPSHPEMLGRIGRYEVERLIGAGGMGVVFKAFDTELNRPVAIKVLAPYLTVSGSARQRFAREARAAAAIVHEHVVAIHNVETNERSPYLVMQYVAGESLQARLDRDGPLELRKILRIGMQTAAALAAAHAQGLVHRDVKPSNIMLEEGIERTLLTDFGLARANDDASLTCTGFHPGTPQYMSPEQARGDAVDSRSDLFSLGSVLYAMCTGRPPFRAETGYGILRRITDTEPRPIREVNSDIPEWLEGFVKKLHAKAVDERFASASEVRDLLEQCLAHIQQPTATAMPLECLKWSKRPARRGLRSKLVWLSGATIILVIGIGFSMNTGFSNLIFGGSDPDMPRQNAAQSLSDNAATQPASVSQDWDPMENDLQQWSEDWRRFEQRLNPFWPTE